MTEEQWSSVESYFASLHELDAPERAAALAGIPDADVRREVESLLGHAGEGDTVAEAVGAAAIQLDWAEVRSRRVGAYRLVHKLGQGGQGTVFEAVRDDAAFDQRVAVKIVRWEMDSDLSRARFRQERQILAGLQHPNIARLLDGGETEEGLPYLVMEFIEGRTLTQATEGWPERRKLEIFRKVCEPVEYAHRNLVIHRDLKPGNILVTAEGEPKLLDFGIAKLLDPAATLTQTGLTALSPDYASPEQVRGQPISTASDVYSLGIILYELLTGRRPYKLDTLTAYEMDRVICQEPPAPPNLGDELDHILLMAMRKEPERRYGSVRQLSEDIESYLNDRAVSARPDTVRYRAAKFVRRNWAGVAVTGLVLATMTAGVVATTYQARRAERRFAQVRGLANRFLFEFDKEILNIPGTTKAREMLVRTALEYLDSLASEASNDRGLKLELATAYVRVGGIQGYPARPNLGKMDAAVVSYGKALALLEPVSNGGATRPELRVLNEAWEALSQVQHAQKSPASVASVQQSLKYGRLLCVDTPERPDDYNAVAAPLFELSFAASDEGRYEEARARIDEARHYRELQAQAAPAAASEWRLAGLNNEAARVAVRVGDLDAALAGIARAHALIQSALAKEPANVRYKRLSFVISNLEADLEGSRTQPSRHDAAKARAAALKAIELAEASMRSDPNSVLAKFDFAVATISGAELAAVSDPPQAIQWARTSLEMLDGLRAKGHSPAQIGPYERWASGTLAEALIYDGKLPEARAILAKLIENGERDAAQPHPEAHTLDVLAGCHRRMGLLYSKSHQFNDSIRELQRARELGIQSQRLHPEDIILRCSLSECYRQLAAAAQLANNGALRTEALEGDLAMWREWNRTRKPYRYSREREAEALLNAKAGL